MTLWYCKTKTYIRARREILASVEHVLSAPATESGVNILATQVAESCRWFRPACGSPAWAVPDQARNGLIPKQDATTNSRLLSVASSDELKATIVPIPAPVPLKPLTEATESL